MRSVDSGCGTGGVAAVVQAERSSRAGFDRCERQSARLCPFEDFFGPPRK